MKNVLLEPKKEFEIRNNKEYKVKSIVNSMIYNKKVESKMKKGYPEEKST